MSINDVKGPFGAPVPESEVGAALLHDGAVGPYRVALEYSGLVADVVLHSEHDELLQAAASLVRLY